MFIRIHIQWQHESFLYLTQSKLVTYQELLTFITSKVIDEQFLVYIQTNSDKIIVSDEETFQSIKKKLEDQNEKLLKILVVKPDFEQSQFQIMRPNHNDTNEKQINQEQFEKAEKGPEENEREQSERKVLEKDKEVFNIKFQQIEHQQNIPWGLQCWGCQKDIVGICYACYFCRDGFVCQECEELNFHIHHPLIKLKQADHLNKLTESREGRLKKIIKTFKEKLATPVQDKIRKGSGFFEKLFGNGDEGLYSDEEDNDTNQLKQIKKHQNPDGNDELRVFMRATRLANLFEKEDPREFMDLVKKNQKLTDEQLVEEILKSPEFLAEL